MVAIAKRCPGIAVVESDRVILAAFVPTVEGLRHFVESE